MQLNAKNRVNNQEHKFLPCGQPFVRYVHTPGFLLLSTVLSV